MLKDGPAGFDVGQVLFSLVFAAALFDQSVDAPDAFERSVADGEIEFADEAAGAEGGQGLAQFDQLRFALRGRFVRLVVASAGLLGQTGRAALLETAQPLANSRHGGAKQACSGFDAALFGALDQAQAVVVRVRFHLTNQIEVTGRNHSPRIVAATAGRPWKSRCEENQKQVSLSAWKSRLTRGIPPFPPPRRRSSSPHLQQTNNLLTPFLTHAFQSCQGDTM